MSAHALFDTRPLSETSTSRSLSISTHSEHQTVESSHRSDLSDTNQADVLEDKTDAPLIAPFWSPFGPLETVPLTPWPHLYTGYAPAVSTVGSYPTEPLAIDCTPARSTIPGLESWSSNLSAPEDRTLRALQRSAVDPVASLSAVQTSLTPLMAGFLKDDTSAYQLAFTPGWSSGLGVRHRSSTFFDSPSTSTLATPHTAWSHAYPYPLPHSAVSPRSYHPPRMYRNPSAPAVTHPKISSVKRIVHPSPAINSPTFDLNWQRMAGCTDEFQGMTVPVIAEPKQARFKPTKEQLDILFAAYEENPNPSASTREMLARKLGVPNTKTIGIWFQNRRSKSRAKERADSLPHPLRLRGRTCSDDGSMTSRSVVDLGALRRLAHDDDPSLILLPLTVLAVSSWTRFLTPGTGFSAPDLGASLSDDPHPRLHLYVTHQAETFRISVPIASSTFNDIRVTWGNVVAGETVAVAFDLAPGVAELTTWVRGGDCGAWKPVSDFTGGAATGGGICELTGSREILLPAFAQIQTMVAAPPVYTPSTAVSLSTWRYPTGVLADDHDLLDCSNHLAPNSIDPRASTGSAMMQANETGWPDFVRSHSPHSNRSHLGHTRQRSASAPGRYDTDGFGVAPQLQQHHDGETHCETLGACHVDLESSYEDSGAER